MGINADSAGPELIEPAADDEASCGDGNDQTEADLGEDAAIDSNDRASHSDAAGRPPRRMPEVRTALVIELVAVLALGGLVGWFGHRGYQGHETQRERSLYLQVGRQGALNLTTIDYTRVDADIQRVLDSSTGSFYDDFHKRSPTFAELVKQTQSKSQGTITEAGLEAVTGTEAQVLVAVTVKTSNIGAAEQDPRHWRMRITVQKVGEGAKVSNVGFVP